jgi:hypothetical protein
MAPDPTSDIFNLDVHFGLHVKPNMKKQAIRIIVDKKLVAENVFTTYDFPKLEQSGMSELE